MCPGISTVPQGMRNMVSIWIANPASLDKDTTPRMFPIREPGEGTATGRSRLLLLVKLGEHEENTVCPGRVFPDRSGYSLERCAGPGAVGGPGFRDRAGQLCRP